jgi:hypothetical protein
MVDSFNFDLLYSSVESLHLRHQGRNLDRDKAIRLVHIVNPVNVPEDHDLARAQSVTYHSMREAAAFAVRNDSALNIEFVSTQFSEDEAAVPEDFIKLPNLNRDCSKVGNFGTLRKLPLVDEVICRAREYAETSLTKNEQTFIVFTNVDIGLLPHFYCYAAWLIRVGHDVSIINRRQIKDCYGGVEDLPKMLSDFGYTHPGLDCFIFKSEYVDKFVSHDSIIGMAHVMRPLYFNLMVLARNPVLLTDAHATFHIGIDSEWQSAKYQDYANFNQEECLKLIKLLSEDPEIERKLTEFVHATYEHSWVPQGVLGVVKPTTWKITKEKLSNRIGRIARLLKELAVCFKF